MQEPVLLVFGPVQALPPESAADEDSGARLRILLKTGVKLCEAMLSLILGVMA